MNQPGDLEIDPPIPAFTFVPTSVYEAQWVRSWGVGFCRDNDLPAIVTNYPTTHQFTCHFRITAEGAMITDMDLSLAREIEETRRTHHGH